MGIKTNIHEIWLLLSILLQRSSSNKSSNTCIPTVMSIALKSVNPSKSLLSIEDKNGTFAVELNEYYSYCRNGLWHHTIVPTIAPAMITTFSIHIGNNTSHNDQSIRLSKYNDKNSSAGRRQVNTTNLLYRQNNNHQ